MGAGYEAEEYKCAVPNVYTLKGPGLYSRSAYGWYTKAYVRKPEDVAELVRALEAAYEAGRASMAKDVRQLLGVVK